MSNNVEENVKTKPVFCWRCRQNIIRGSKRSSGLFKFSVVMGIYGGAKRYSKEQLKQIRR